MVAGHFLSIKWGRLLSSSEHLNALRTMQIFPAGWLDSFSQVVFLQFLFEDTFNGFPLVGVVALSSLG